MAQDLVRICFDRVLEPDQLIQAAERAIEENPANLPIPIPGSGPPDPFEMALETRTLWRPGRTLRVRFMDGIASVQEKVAQVTQGWAPFTNIKFDFGTDPDAEIRISFNADPGSWSYLGTDALSIPKNQPTMNYGWLEPNTDDEEYHRVVLHEFGHALGCIHEHQHPLVSIPWNKEAVYKKYAGPPNFWSKAKVDRNLFQKYDTTQTQYSEFDKDSIMLYPVPKALTDGVFEVGWNTQLSATDMEFIGKVYPFESKPVVDLAIGADPVEASIGVHGEEDRYRFVVQNPGHYFVETAGRTDVYMTMFGPDNETNQIAQDDDSGPGLNARVGAELAPGVYHLKVRHYRPTGTGAYQIKVRAGE